MSTNLVIDFVDLYKKTFGAKPYVVPVQQSKIDTSKFATPSTDNTLIKSGILKGVNPDDFDTYNQFEITPKQIVDYVSDGGSPLSKQLFGVEIWLPTTLQTRAGDRWDLPYSVISIAGSSTWIETPLAERRGTVKELYSIDDYKINIKGFFIDKQRRLFPDTDLKNLKKVHEAGESLFLFNALTDIFLTLDDMVVIKSFDLPAVEGGKKSMRPFTMSLDSDSIFTLELDDTP